MRLAVVGLFIIAGSTMAADDSDNKKLFKALEGAYKMTAAEASGEFKPPPGFLDSIEKVTIKGNKLSFFFKGEGGKSEEKTATIALDAAAAPAHFDVMPEDGPNKGKTILGIVALEGETLKLCFNHAPGGNRPAEFKTAKGDNDMNCTLKKIKE